MDSVKDNKITTTLELLFRPGEVVELRTIGTDDWHTIRSGYYSDFEKLATKALDLNTASDRDMPSNIFITLNPVQSSLISRAENRTKTKPRNTTTDEEISAVRWLPIDLDPVRPKGIPSTEEERLEAFSRAAEIKKFLAENGFSDPIMSSSGNGVHLLYKITDNPDLDKAASINKHIIHTLASKFSDNKVDVDKAVWNPSRIWKLYGTTAIKGENTADRPHRLSTIVDIPTDLQITPNDVLDNFVIKFDKPEETADTSDEEINFIIENIIKKYDKLNKLFSGDIGSFKSRSEAELSLCTSFIAITQSRDLTYKLMGCSKIGKWGDDSYNDITFEKALEFSKKDFIVNSTKINQFRKILINNNQSTSLEEIKKIAADNRDLRLNIDLPPDHFVSKYVKWLTNITDGYQEYQILSAFWLLSSIVERRIVLNTAQEEIYPNLWITILGQSTVSRKSTILGKTKAIYQGVTESELYNNDYSLEGYLELLEREPITAFVRDEVAGLIAKMHKKYNEGIFELECAIFDGQNYKKTLSSGKGKDKAPHEVVVSGQYVTKLYATTGDNFAAKTDVDDFLCGYGYRFLYAFPNYKKPWKGIMMQTAENIDNQSEVTKHLEKIQLALSNEGMVEADISEKAMDLYNRSIWEIELKVDNYNDGRFSSAIGRAEIYIFKLAMLIELGEADVDLQNFTISANSIDKATHMISNYFLPTMMGLLDRLQEDKKYNMIERVSAAIRELGGTTTRSILLRRSRMKAKDFDECILTMEDSGEVICKQEKESKITYYILAKNQTEYSLDYKLKNIADDNPKGQSKQSRIGNITTKVKPERQTTIPKAPKTPQEDLWS